MVSDDLPNARPLQSDTVHVVVGDLYNFLETEHPWLMCWGQLIHGHRTQPTDKIHLKKIQCKINAFSCCGTQRQWKNIKLTYRISIKSCGTCEDPAETNIVEILSTHVTNVQNIQCDLVFTCPQLQPHFESWSLQQTPECEQFAFCLDFQPHCLKNIKKLIEYRYSVTYLHKMHVGACEYTKEYLYTSVHFSN